MESGWKTGSRENAHTASTCPIRDRDSIDHANRAFVARFCVLGKFIEFFEKDAPLAAMQLRAGLDVSLSSPPRQAGSGAGIVHHEKKAAQGHLF
jgi:hypothetical protein